jgi:hypothetical protein
MQPTPRHEAAEADFHRMLETADLPAPDEVEYRRASVVFLWKEPKVAVVVDLEDPPLAV